MIAPQQTDAPAQGAPAPGGVVESDTTRAIQDTVQQRLAEYLPEPVVDALSTTVLGNSLAVWIVAVLLALATLVALRVVRGVIVRRARQLLASPAAEKRREGWQLVIQLASKITPILTIVLAIRVGSLALTRSPTAEGALRVLVILGIGWQAFLWGRTLVEAGIESFLDRRRGPDGQPDPSLATTSGLLRFVGHVLLVSVVVLLAAENMGIDVTALVAGLGVGGIAIALAAQTILGDLFASLAIVMDKPFVVGDFIIVGTEMGTVERVGLKTTRVRSLSGEQLVFGNNDLLASRIRNYKRMNERRALFTIGVVYQTPADVLERIPTMIREAVEAEKNARFDRAHFKAFGPSSLDFEAVFHVLVPEMVEYLNIQQRVNLALVRRFEKEGIEFAYPTQTLYVARAT